MMLQETRMISTRSRRVKERIMKNVASAHRGSLSLVAVERSLRLVPPRRPQYLSSSLFQTGRVTAAFSAPEQTGKRYKLQVTSRTGITATGHGQVLFLSPKPRRKN